MHYTTEFSDPLLVSALRKEIQHLAEKINRKITVMEVCGTHTVSIFRHGLAGLMPENIRLVSGPGCPVCVTPRETIDRYMAALLGTGSEAVCFGDMLKVPGSYASLNELRVKGVPVRIVSGALDAIELALQEPKKRFIFFAVGFETTVPGIAIAIKKTVESGISNLKFLSAHKLVPPALEALLSSKKIGLDGFILPGHVSAIIGRKAYDFLEKYRIPGVIAGFEPCDILDAVRRLLEMLLAGDTGVQNCYTRAVREEGNPVARGFMDEVFFPVPSRWRGLGAIPDSGLEIKDSWSSVRIFGDNIKTARDVSVCNQENCCEMSVEFKEIEERIRQGLEELERLFGQPTGEMDSGCICGEIILGLKRPDECPLFRKVCTPSTPAGACMVSQEGTCAAYFKYGSDIFEN